MRPILLAFAHPDDESSGVGGTVAKYSERGVPVDLICATRGEKGTRLGVPDGVATGVARENGLREVATILGIRKLHFLGYRDSQLAQADPEEVAGKVMDIMRQDPPEVVITFGPDGISGHSDHVAIGRAATTAFERLAAADPGLRKLYYVTIPRSALSELGEFDLHTRPDDEVTTSIDITGYLDKKIRALEAHGSQQDAREVAEMFRGYRDMPLARRESLYLANRAVPGKETDLFE